MQSLNSSTAKSSAVLPMLAGAVTPKLGGSAAESGASFSQMLRDSGPAVSPSAAPAAPSPAPAPAAVRDKGEQRSQAQAESDTDKPQATDDSEPQAAEGRPAAAQATQQAQALKQRRVSQEREQSARQADDRQASVRAAGKAEDGANLQAADEAGTASIEDESADPALLPLDAVLSAQLASPLSTAPAAKAAGDGGLSAADAAAQAAAASAGLMAGKTQAEAASPQAKLPEVDSKAPSRTDAVDAGGKRAAGQAEALDIAAKGEQQQTAQSQGEAGASFATELKHAEQAATAPALPSFTAAAASTAQQGAAKAAAAETAARLDVAARLESPQFSAEMSARLSVLAADGVQQAELHLNPAEMGPVSVQIVMDGQQAQISFHAESSETRSVLEKSLPELASALRDQGLTLSGGGVFQQSAGQRQAQASDQNSRQGRNADSSEDEGGASAATVAAPAPRQLRGVVDVYA